MNNEHDTEKMQSFVLNINQSMNPTRSRSKESLSSISVVIHEVGSLAQVSQQKARQYKKHKGKLHVEQTS